MGKYLEQLRTTLCAADEDCLNDATLLKRFIACGDESAFATIVQRHGAMVMGVCRRLVCEAHDAEDAFQATFLILVRKAASIAKPRLLANWLYGVAYNTALKARATSIKHRSREKLVIEMPERAAEERDSCVDEQRALLHQELSRLPEKYRAAIILCDLQAKTRREAAQLLGCAEGSLSSRLARGRALLARRFARHGLLISSALVASALAQEAASAHVPAILFSTTVRSAVLLASGSSAISGISPKVVALMEGVLKVMVLSNLRTGMLWLAVCLTVVGTGLAVYYQKTMAQTQPLEQAKAGLPPAPPKDRKKPETQTDDDLKKDMIALQGKWYVVSEMTDGEQAPAEILKQVFAVFAGNIFTFRPGISYHVRDNGKIGYDIDQNPDEFPFELKAGTRFTELHFTAQDAETKDRSIFSIYKLEGDILTLCIGDPNGRSGRGGLLPTEFTGKKGSNQSLWVLKRVSKEVEPALRGKSGEVLFGPTPIGDKVSKNVVVKGSAAFRILEVRGGEGVFEAVNLDKDSKEVHIVTITFKPEKEGEVVKTLKIVSDLKKDGEIELNVKGVGK
jgi:RNA polymerase sigma factor (sigma-70 family)